MDEVDAPKITAGQTVRISFDALPKQSFPGKVKRVAPYVSAVEKQARTVDIEATLDAGRDARRACWWATAPMWKWCWRCATRWCACPPRPCRKAAACCWPDADGTLQERQIKAGLANWEFTEVLEGLAAGDKVVTSLEREGVKAGARVRRPMTAAKK